ncbi:MAG: Ribonuclease [Gammaproteobacteria bacterium]|jgi:ribonuclease HII|nr:Ribonuclease [Gammaproteobacteria bacterium]
MIIIGVDEAGRGPLAGPVTAAAVVLSSARKISGLNDSKLLNAKQREYLFEKIYDKADAVAVAHASVEEIDKLNILQASLLAMQRAVAMLKVEAELVLIDGNICPKLSAKECFAVIGGDRLVQEISAASIIAKVTRDREMQRLHEVYPGYGFDRHCGYGTPKHLDALDLLGACYIHRRSFAPVRERLNRES